MSAVKKVYYVTESVWMLHMMLLTAVLLANLKAKLSTPGLTLQPQSDVYIRVFGRVKQIIYKLLI